MVSGEKANITASGDISSSGDIYGNNLTLSGDATIKGNLTFGDSTSDSINFGAEVSSSVLPDADNTYDLGSTSKAWKSIYSNRLYLTGSTTNLYSNGTARLSLGSTNVFIGDVSASGDLYGDELRLTGGKIYEDGTERLSLGTINKFTGDLSASGDIYISVSFRPPGPVIEATAATIKT